MENPVQHNPEQDRFEIQIDGEIAYLEYEERGKTLIFTHTYVPPSLRGKGLAGKLTVRALDFARKEGKTVDPQCSYVSAWLDSHPDFADLREPNS
jgi:predicted GNAT family acetyltransferase